MQVLAMCFGLWGLNLQPTLNFCSEILLQDRIKSFHELSCMLSGMILMVLVCDTKDKIQLTAGAWHSKIHDESLQFSKYLQGTQQLVRC